MIININYVNNILVKLGNSKLYYLRVE